MWLLPHTDGEESYIKNQCSDSKEGHAKACQDYQACTAGAQGFDAVPIQ